MEQGCELAAGAGSSWDEGQSLGGVSAHPSPEEQGSLLPCRGDPRVWSPGSAVPLDEEEHWVVQRLSPVGQRVIHCHRTMS